MEQQVGYQEFQNVAQSPGEARLLHKAMGEIAKGGAGPLMQQMAKEVLSGRKGFREAFNDPAYTDELVSQTQGMQHRLAELSEDEKQEQAEQGRRLIEDEDRAIDDEASQAGEVPPAARWHYQPGQG